MGPGSPYTHEAESEKEAAFSKAASLTDSDFLPLAAEMEQIARNIKGKR
jgi:hypothetical protein